jgi:hypothetical protein
MTKTITLTDKGTKAGPNFSVYYSIDGISFTFLEITTLSSIGSTIVVTIPDATKILRLISIGNCGNEVSHLVPGSTLGDFWIDFSQYDFN